MVFSGVLLLLLYFSVIFYRKGGGLGEEPVRSADSDFRTTIRLGLQFLTGNAGNAWFSTV